LRAAAAPFNLKLDPASVEQLTMKDRHPLPAGERGSRPPRIFVSYRRDDTAPYAGRLYDALTEHFGDANVFMDVDTIALGTDFTAAIDRALASCDAVVTLIGRSWLDATGADGRRRLDDPTDVLRLELERALSGALVVVPTCVQGAALPTEEQLPPTLAPLARRQGIELRDTVWRDESAAVLDGWYVLAREGAGVGTDTGTCTADDFLGEGVYLLGAAVAGRRFCYFENGEANLVWTDAQAGVGGIANVWSGTGAEAAATLLTQWRCCFQPQR
jgi:hypothetical protein